ncbi:sugar kinase [Amycolatopsis nigrescens]|uniref:sugar kinase n=1 Tax=Amycolatopsis nigrescens TaxID=381445 RepID=UPI0003655841|nr:sugar kinase [Amycolatopsis nigrescens]
MSGGLFTLGETMAVFTTPSGRLRHAATVNVGMAGAESNVAIGVRRLGGQASWQGRVGADEPGALVLSKIRGEDVETGTVVTDEAARTGLMLKDYRTADVMRVTYYREHSAGSRLCEADLDAERIAAAGVLHLTGITPALSGSARAAVFTAAEIARSAGVPVSFDVNYRAALWPAELATPVLTDLAGRADVLFAGDDETALLGMDGSGAGLLDGMRALGPAQVVLKLGARGALADVGGARHEVPAFEVRAVDAVGAGDAFVAGYLAELLAGAPPAERLRTAAACGAFAVSVLGDWEGLPTREDLGLLTKGGTVLR